VHFKNFTVQFDACTYVIVPEEIGSKIAREIIAGQLKWIRDSWQNGSSHLAPTCLMLPIVKRSGEHRREQSNFLGERNFFSAFLTGRICHINDISDLVLAYDLF